MESLLFTLTLSGTGYLHGSVLLVRYVLAPVLHAGLSAIVVMGYCSGRKGRLAALALASCIHASYNLAAILVAF